MPQGKAMLRSSRTVPGRIALCAIVGMTPLAGAQDQPANLQRGEPEIQMIPRDVPGEVARFEIPAWSDADIARVGQMLVGSYRSQGAVAERSADASSEVWLHIAQTHVEGLSDVMYLEAHRSDAPDRPYRQSYLQLYRAGDSIRLRSFEAKNLYDGMEAYAGFWAIPDQFPLLSRENLIATMDVLLTARGSGFEGASPHGYPTDLLGAIEMTSAIRFDGTTLQVADRGYDALGDRVWGPVEGEWITLRRDTYPLDVRQSETGLTILTYPGDFSRAPEAGDSVRFAYTGWLWDNGRRFASSDDDGILPEVPWPLPPGTLNWAWEETVQDMALGMTRRVVSPPERAFRLRGWAQKGVPPMARVVFHLQCVNIEKLPPQDPAQGNAPPTNQGG